MDHIAEIFASLLRGRDKRQSLPPLGNLVVGRTSDGRPVVQNLDHSLSTERSVTVLNPAINRGRPTNIPTLFDILGTGVPQQSGEDDAVRFILENGRIAGSSESAGLVVDPITGRRLPGFANIESAERAAKDRSSNIRFQLFGPRR